MADLYLDPIGGNDANNGTTFALRFKTITSGATAARTAPGDRIKIMKSPDPTSLGVTGVFTEGPYGVSVAIASSTNATPIVVTLSSGNYTILAPAVGDTLIVNAHTTNTKANGVWEIGAIDGTNHTVSLVNPDGTNSVGNGVGGASGTLKKINSCLVKLSSAVTKSVAVTGNQGVKANWTAGTANVTNTVITSDFKEGGECQQIAINASFTTGLAAYFPLGASTDFSAYKQLTFWIKQTAGTIGAAGAITMTLCSDTAGVTAVDTFSIPALGTLNRWIPITVDKGAALGSTIQSVAFKVVTDNAAQTFLVDNIVACKDSTSADSLTLQSLIGKNATGDSFFAIQSVNATRVMLEQETNYIPTTAPALGYFGASETVTAYKRETFKTALATTLTASVFTINEGGTVGNLITYSGGWDATDMSTQTGETWFDGLSGAGSTIDCGFAYSYLGFDNLSFVRYYRVFSGFANVNYSFTLGHLNNNSASPVDATVINGNTVNAKSICNNGALGIALGQSCVSVFGNINGNAGNGLVSGNGNLINVTKIAGNIAAGISCTGRYNKLTVPTIKANGTYGINFQDAIDNILYGATISGHSDVYASVGVVSQTLNKNYLVGCTLSDTTKVQAIPVGFNRDAGVYSQNENNTAGNHIGRLSTGTIQSETSIRHTALGISWKLSPTTTTYVNSTGPFFMPVAKVACSASTLVTVKLWMRRTNTGLTARLVCKGGQIAGVASDVSTAMTVAADTWEQATITFTPTETGVVEIVAECWGGTTYSLYVDDLTIS